MQVGLAPCMIWGLDEASLRETRKAADELGVLITMHVSETPFEIEHSKRLYGRTDTAFLSDIGFLNPDVLAVHCVKCSPEDIAALRRHGTKVSHNPAMVANLYEGGRPTVGAGYRARAASRRSSTRSRALVPPPRHVCERQELLASDALTLASRHSVTAGESCDGSTVADVCDIAWL